MNKEELFFPPEYFRDEERDGFFVSGLMKTTWAAELKVLFELEKIFDKYGLRYYADFGTLLGAVRHGGFIPWDDDIDIAMPRSDFMKFINVCKELPEPYKILSIYTSDTFYNFHAVASNYNGEKLKWDPDHMKEFYGCPFIVNIDIYPLDHISDNEEKAGIQKLLYTMSYQLVHTLVDIETRAEHGGDVSDEELIALSGNIDQLKGYLKQFFGEAISVDESLPLRNALCRVTDALATISGEGESTYIDYYAHMAYLDEPLLRNKEWYKHVIRLPFETTTIAAPAVYTEVLKKRFGPGFMQMIRENSAHGYPFFSNQLEYFHFVGKLQ
ncbi:MAG: LicD family protein [Lachnospiraceae bacterium]|nr:LicD family protein [Lachnospiraceae bacterium]